MTIPYWHPLVVHFPIVLITVGGLGALAWSLYTNAFARRFALILLALGTAGAFAARQTGPAFARSMEGDPMVERHLEAHETAGNWAFVLAFCATIVLGGAELGGRHARPGAGSPLFERMAVVLLALGAVAAVVRAGHLGGLMVWGVSEMPAPAPGSGPER